MYYWGLQQPTGVPKTALRSQDPSSVYILYNIVWQGGGAVWVVRCINRQILLVCKTIYLESLCGTKLVPFAQGMPWLLCYLKPCPLYKLTLLVKGI